MLRGLVRGRRLSVDVGSHDRSDRSVGSIATKGRLSTGQPHSLRTPSASSLAPAQAENQMTKRYAGREARVRSGVPANGSMLFGAT